MKDHERERLIEIVRGMTREEHEVIADLLPIDLVLKRIGTEIQEKERLNQMIIGMGLAVQNVDSSSITEKIREDVGNFRDKAIHYGDAQNVQMTSEVIAQLNRGAENGMKSNRRELPKSFA